MNLRPSGYEPDELPGCSTPRQLFGRCRPGSPDFSGVLRPRSLRLLRANGVLLHPASNLGMPATNRRADIRDEKHAFGRPGSDLLSQALRLSTIGAEGFNGRVRDGIGFWAPRNCHQVDEKRLGEFWFSLPARGQQRFVYSGTDRRPSLSATTRTGMD